MPKESQAGYSDNTPIKQEHFRTIMRTLCRVVKGIIGREDYVLPHFVYIDLNAGPGWYTSPTLFGPGYPGSPIIALDIAHQDQLSLMAHVIDHDHHAMGSLHTHLETIHGFVDVPPLLPGTMLLAHPQREAVVCLWPHDAALVTAPIIDGLREDMAHQGKTQVYGVIYTDVNGGNILFDDLAEYSHVFSKMDLILHLSATHRKRVQGRYGTRPPIVDAIGQIKKRHWIVRTPAGREQWTFLIGTNWDAFPDFSRHGFVTIDSPIGRAIMQTISSKRGGV